MTCKRYGFRSERTKKLQKMAQRNKNFVHKSRW